MDYDIPEKRPNVRILPTEQAPLTKSAIRRNRKRKKNYKNRQNRLAAAAANLQKLQQSSVVSFHSMSIRNTCSFQEPNALEQSGQTIDNQQWPEDLNRSLRLYKATTSNVHAKDVLSMDYDVPQELHKLNHVTRLAAATFQESHQTPLLTSQSSFGTSANLNQVKQPSHLTRTARFTAAKTLKKSLQSHFSSETTTTLNLEQTEQLVEDAFSFQELDENFDDEQIDNQQIYEEDDTDDQQTENTNGTLNREPVEQHVISKPPCMSNKMKAKPNCALLQKPFPVRANIEKNFNSSLSSNKYKQIDKNMLNKLKGLLKLETPNHLCVAIIDTSNSDGKIAKNDAVVLQQQLKNALDGLLFSQQQPIVAPTFYDMFYVDQFLRVYCENDFSLKWLHKTVEDLPKLWSNSELAVVEISTLPDLFVYATLFVPGKAEELDVILHRLNVHNPWANVNDWRVLKYQVKENCGVNVYFGIKAQLHAALENKICKLHYGLYCLKLRLHL